MQMDLKLLYYYVLCILGFLFPGSLWCPAQTSCIWICFFGKSSIRHERFHWYDLQRSRWV